MVIKTPRLLLRAFAPDDRDAFVRWHTHPPNREFKWDGVLSAADARRDFEELLNANNPHESGYLAIELLKRGVAIGQIGLFPTPDRTAVALAYLIDEPAWGFGYATEASQAIIEESRRRYPERSVIAVIPDGHGASERVAEKLGMVPMNDEVRNEMRVRRWILARRPENRRSPGGSSKS